MGAIGPHNGGSVSIGDTVKLLSGSCEMLVVDVRPEGEGVIAAWKNGSGLVSESWFPMGRLRMVRRMSKF